MAKPSTLRAIDVPSGLARKRSGGYGQGGCTLR